MTEFFVALLILCGPDAGAGIGCRHNALMTADATTCAIVLEQMEVTFRRQPGEDFAVVRRECIPVAITGERGA